MQWWVRLLGMLVGLQLAGFTGAVIGLAVGYGLEKVLQRDRLNLNTKTRAKIEGQFLVTLFGLMGHLAKLDGQIYPSEVAFARHLMDKMRLNAQRQHWATTLFNEGTQPGFDWVNCVTEFNRVCDSGRVLLSYLVALVLEDPVLHPAKVAALQLIAQHLGFNAELVAQLLRMARAQQHFQQGKNYRQRTSEFDDDAQPHQHEQHRSEHHRPRPTSALSPLELAYEALGVNVTDADTTIKKAYRKLMSQYHPDKLSGQGVPPEIINNATAKTQSIQAAYELIKKQRR